MQSLQTKLATGLLLSLIIIFSAMWLLVSINVQFLADEYIASRLKHDAETLLSSVRFDDKANMTIDTSRIGLVYNQPFSGHYYLISSVNQNMSSRSLWDQRLKHITQETGGESRALQQGPEQQSLLVVSVVYSKQGQQLTITVAEDLNPIKKNINQFQYGFAAMAFCMLLILVIFQVLILRRSLNPLIKIHTELKSLEQGQLDKLSTDSPTELRPLINEVNHLLSVMEQRLRRSRNSLGDLAHAIKKPLTVIQQTIDKNDVPDIARDTLKKQADDIYQISDRILKRARLAGHSHSGSLFTYSEDLPALIKTLDMMYGNKEVLFSADISEKVICPIDREDMMELLGNLLDNAYKWANHKVFLSVGINTDLCIGIEDDGPGADPVKINELAQRGVRLDEQIEGHGFGLAIATDIVTEYNGKLLFDHSTSLGGFRVDIQIPLNQL